MFSAQKSAAPANDKLYVEDVFSTWLYTGNGGTQTITNGIDLSGKGGLVWIKCRSLAGENNVLLSQVSGSGSHYYWTFSDLTGGSSPSNSSDTYFLQQATGFRVGPDSFSQINGNGQTFASWTFRKAPKFFDVVTYTGNGANRTIAHSLGVAPGCILVKRTDGLANWQVYHRSNANTEYMVLNTTAAKATGTTRWNSTTPTATEFTVGTDATVNASGGTYVAYLFAHDATSTGIIQCGSYTGNGTANSLIATLGFEPQWLLVKRTDTTSDWIVVDVMRGAVAGGDVQNIYPNSSAAEVEVGSVAPGATGIMSGNTAAWGESNASGGTYIYIAIRRGPMKTPTLGTSVFTPIAWSGTGSATSVTGTSYPVDMAFVKARNTNSNGPIIVDRLRNVTNTLYSPYTQEETANSYVTGSDIMNGLKVGTSIDTNMSSITYVYEMFRRAPGFFDEVCYTGTGVSGQTINHNLGVAPELIIVKKRNASSTLGWAVGTAFTSSGSKQLFLNNTDAASDTTYNGFITSRPTTSAFNVSAYTDVGASVQTYVAYLFASCPGVSKVGSYTGNGSSQTIDCGFAAGARFVLIKRTDSTGAWYVWDTARGIVAGNDPYFRLNSTLAEIASNDTIDTDSTGFVVNQVAATNVNVSSATYIYLAIA